jgi:hypothetical protein
MRRLLLIALFTVAGCATPPGKIEPFGERTGTCDRDALEQATKQQKRAVETDILSVALIGVPVSRIAGTDRAGEIAQMKRNCQDEN